MNGKISVFDICVGLIIDLILYNFGGWSFKV